MKNVIVIGGGAAGLMAAVSAAEHGAASVTILEKMPAVGRKLLITGKGRCNLTNHCDVSGLVKNMPGNGSFLYSAFHSFGNQDLVNFLARWGLETKVERGGRVFPVSDRAHDVVRTFLRMLEKLNIRLLTGQKVEQLTVVDGRITEAITTTGRYPGEEFILATGGASYPGTGSSGDGYRIAAALGHQIIDIRPSLAPLEVAEEWVKELQGLSLKNVQATLLSEGKKIAAEFGEMLFTHFGLSGPIILSLSHNASRLLTQHPDRELTIEINLKPALSEEQLDKRLQRDFAQFSRKQLKNSLHELLPSKMIPVMIDLSFLDPDKFVHQLTRTERLRLMQKLQHLSFTVTATRPISEAIVTAGGVHVKELDASSMRSRLLDNLFFAGELIDIDGYTGGFNLQAAFSTGFVAGRSAAESF
ncbi:MAG TPA: NAD(P)/FAD-dependent oxidoreductase [Patescibacteria group bacterium]|nr:NAD(P)/FAD-dependent oxidoreductase [Patescibacteria group bacterium]